MRPTRRRVTTLFFATALVLACSPAHAGAPTDRLREFFAKVNAILADPGTEDRPLERVARVRRLVNDVADVPSAAARALGAEWERRTAAEREEFVAIFTELLERAYVGRLAGAVHAAGGVVMTYGDEVRTGDEAKVMTTLRGPGHDLRVEYAMTLRTGRWRVRDIVIDGVSTVENYRAQFSRVLHQESYAGLVRQLREKLGGDGLMFARWVRPTPQPIEQEMPATTTPGDGGSRSVAAAPPKARPPSSTAPAKPRPLVTEPPRATGPEVREERPRSDTSARSSAGAPPVESAVRTAPVESTVRATPAESAVRPSSPVESTARPEPPAKPVERPAPRRNANVSRAVTPPTPPPAAAAMAATDPALDTHPDVLEALLGALVIGAVGAAIVTFVLRRNDLGSRPDTAPVLWVPDETDRPRDLRTLAGAQPERRLSRNGTSHTRTGDADRSLES